MRTCWLNTQKTQPSQYSVMYGNFENPQQIFTIEELSEHLLASFSYGVRCGVLVLSLVIKVYFHYRLKGPHMRSAQQECLYVLTYRTFK